MPCTAMVEGLRSKTHSDGSPRYNETFLEKVSSICDNPSEFDTFKMNLNQGKLNEDGEYVGGRRRKSRKGGSRKSRKGKRSGKSRKGKRSGKSRRHRK